MEVKGLNSALKIVQSGITADTPLTTEQVMLYGADGTPQNKVSLHDYIQSLITTYAAGDVVVLCPSGLPVAPASGDEDKIHRVPGTGSYSDYQWDGTSAFVLLATISGSPLSLENNTNPASLLT